MENSISISDMKRYYRFLAHNKETELRPISKNGLAPSVFCHSESEFVNACKEFNGKYQVYAGLNERKASGKNDDDVDYITNIGHDVDCHKDNSSLETADRVCKKYCRDVVSQGLEEPMILLSGGGYWIIHHVEPIENTPENRQRIKMFGEFAKKQYDEDGIDFDTKVYNPSRIARVPGTINLKNGNKAKIINSPSGVACKKFKQQILSMEIPTYDGTTVAEIPKGSCAFMNYCMSHRLPNGERHSVIDRNLSLYIYDRPDMEKLRQQYAKVQEGTPHSLISWIKDRKNNPDKKHPFSCGELIKYQFRNNIPLQCENCPLYKCRNDLGEVRGWANSVSIVKLAKKHNFENCHICEEPFKFQDSHGMYYCDSCKYGGGLKKFAELIAKRDNQ